MNPQAYHFKLNTKPLSVNNAWKGKRYKTDQYKAYERLVLLSLPKLREELPEMIRLEYHFGFSSRNSDVDNPVKLITDILQRKFSFNDSRVWEITARKSIVKKGEEFICIGIHSYLPFD